VGSNAYNNTYNECWGFEVNGSEIAVIGSTAGTHFFDVTNPTNSSEVAFVAGAYTGTGVIHRDYHDFQGYLYAVCDEGSTSTLQIIDISDLPNSINTVYDSNQLFTKSHNIFIDTATAKLYACASTNTAMDIYSLSDPINPILIHSYNDVGHVHDAYVRNDTAYLNCGNDGFRIVDFHYLDLITPIQPIELASLTSYPDAGYNHSGWLNDDGTIYAMQDENHGYDVKILDVSDFNNISVLATFNSGVDPQSMAHNGIIKNDLLYLGYYHDGLRIFDISDPSNPVQTWMYDTYLPNNHNSYKGAWGVYPYLPSGNIIVSDMQSGLFILDCTVVTTLEEINLVNQLFPNPTQNTFTIQSENATLFELFNILGEKVKEVNITNTQTKIQRDELANGLYFYILSNKHNKIDSEKIIFE
jgi:choice-of-anchor B domain-containing protein